MLQHKLKLYVAAPKGVTDRFCFICPSESSRTPKKQRCGPESGTDLPGQGANVKWLPEVLEYALPTVPN